MELQHPNIEAEAAGDTVAGAHASPAETLAQYVARVGRVPVVQAHALAAQLLSALAHAHAQGVAHGAIDAQHLRICRNGQLQVFGFQVQSGRDAAPAADLQAAAAVIYELLTGAPPFEGRARGTPRPVRALRPQLPAELDGVFVRALSPHPDQRFASAAGLSQALQSALGAPVWERPAEPPALVPAPAPAPVAAAPRPERRHEPLAVAPPAPPHGLAALAGPRASTFELALASVCLVALGFTASFFAKPPAPATPTGLMVRAERVEAQPDPREGDAVTGRVLAAPRPMMLVPAASAASVPQAPQPGVQQQGLEPAVSAPAAPAGPSGAGVPQPAGAQQPAVHPAALMPPPEVKSRPMPGASAPPGVRHDAGREREPAIRQASARPGRRNAPAWASLDCRQDVQLARDMCMAWRCATAEYRQHPICVRMHAEQQRQRDVLAGTYGAP